MPITTAPYGSWRSPITIDALLAGNVGLSAPQVHPAGVFWVEGRPDEEGRSVLVRTGPGGQVEDVTPKGFSVQSRVHEYGGGAHTVDGDVVYFVNDEDQRIYRQPLGAAPVAITPAPPRERSLRYADLCVAPGGAEMVCVREAHPAEGHPANELVRLPTDGSAEPTVIDGAHDFVAFPRVSPDGTELAWVAWDHPNMPWDGTELWLADRAPGGSIGTAALIAGGPRVSVNQIRWSPDGVLHFVQDPTGWWNLYAWKDGAAVALAPCERAFAGPQWTFAQSFFAFLEGGRIVCRVVIEGRDAELLIVDPAAGTIEPLAVPDVYIEWLEALGDRIVYSGATPEEPPRIVSLERPGAPLEVLRRCAETLPDPDFISPAEHVTFETADDRVAHAFLYPPHNPDFEAPKGERAPLLVFVHGGPTGAVGSWYSPHIQFWTSRGFAVADVNYRGSTGYGRSFREELYGTCGVAEAEDCVHLVQHLVDAGAVDAARTAIRGGSAGGAVVLTAVTFHDTFEAGTSLYGIGDIEALIRDTHKFECNYLHFLMGPYPEAAELFRERSPIHSADQIMCPVLLLTGAEDRVVLPNQAETFAAALAARDIPHACIVYEGEGHGFRRRDTQRSALEAELSFYAQVLGFEPADDVPELPIAGL